MHDFPADALGKAIPYGIYDMARNDAWVSVGRDREPRVVGESLQLVLEAARTIVDLIGNTRTAKGMRIKAKLDKRKYPGRRDCPPCIPSRDIGTASSTPLLAERL